jgi:hypothetical protein
MKKIVSFKLARFIVIMVALCCLGGVVLPQSKSHSHTGNLQAKKLFEQFLDGIFVKRDAVKTFERLVYFEACNKVDEDIGPLQNCPLEDMPANLGHRTYSRMSAAVWNYEYIGALYYLLGTEPIKETDEAYPYASSEYDALKTEILKKNHSSEPDFDFARLNKQEIEKRLDEMEKNWADLEKAVFERIDKSLYNKNISILKKNIKVIKSVEKNRIYWVAGTPDVVFYFVFSKRLGRMKIIGTGDSI